MKCHACGREDMPKYGDLSLEQQITILNWALRIKEDDHVSLTDIDYLSVFEMMDKGVLDYKSAPRLAEDFGIQVFSLSECDPLWSEA